MKPSDLCLKIMLAALIAGCLMPLASTSILFGQSPTQGSLLVLNNDQVIEGKITVSENRYSITTQTGSRIVIPGSRVRFVADSITDVYWDKWSRVDPEDAQSHINLFRWCLKQGMLKEAQKQIDLVTRIENLDDQSGHLTRMAQELEVVVDRKRRTTQLAAKKELDRLQIRNLPPVEPTEKLADAPTIPSVPLDAEGNPMRTLQPMNIRAAMPNVALVDFEEEVTEEPQVATRRQKPAWVSNRQLDRETRQMPNGTVNFYKRHIEPKLIENCIACHDSRSHSMPLSKRSVGQTIPRRMSQQNLHFVMEQVDRTAPFASPLLTMATTAHGPQETPAFSNDDPTLFEFKKWTVAVSEDPAKWLMQLSEESQQEQADATQQLDVKTPSVAKTASVAKSQVETQSKSTIQTAQQPSAAAAKPTAPTEKPVDPYDPAGFNRK